MMIMVVRKAEPGAIKKKTSSGESVGAAGFLEIREA